LALVNVDAKHLDWTTAVFLSQDAVGIQEIKDGFDLHTDNQRVFGLPSRLIAKIFLFRIIFGGTAFSFYKDPDFDEAKYSLAQWEGVIEKFYAKYKGIYEWHQRIVKEATTKKKLSIPTGRSWRFEMVKNYKGELEWPITQIKNYIVN
jgi:DNA polymerase I-like protein with 3'-5' exonuclease and polymerase domains